MIETRPVILSQGEVEQLCLKAARGAGMEWGLAEEAGFAAAWLAVRGLDGLGALERLLHLHVQRRAVPPVAGIWRAADDSGLCPIATGAALYDFDLLPEARVGAAGLEIGPVRQVLLLLPFLCVFAGVHGKAARIAFAGGQVFLQPDGAVSGDTSLLSVGPPLRVCVTLEPASAFAPAQVSAPLGTEAGVLDSLNRFALATTVPASAQSRSGAGAEVDDSD